MIVTNSQYTSKISLYRAHKIVKAIAVEFYKRDMANKQTQLNQDIKQYRIKTMSIKFGLWIFISIIQKYLVTQIQFLFTLTSLWSTCITLLPANRPRFILLLIIDILLGVYRIYTIITFFLCINRNYVIKHLAIEHTTNYHDRIQNVQGSHIYDIQTIINGQFAYAIDIDRYLITMKSANDVMHDSIILDKNHVPISLQNSVRKHSEMEMII